MIITADGTMALLRLASNHLINITRLIIPPSEKNACYVFTRRGKGIRVDVISLAINQAPSHPSLSTKCQHVAEELS